MRDAGPSCPALVWYLWLWFCELSCGLAPSGFAPPIVTWEALESWSRQMDIDVAPWEARMLVRLGQMRADILMEKAATPAPQKPPPKRKRK